MFISKLELKNFKRFTDLTIDLSEVKTPPKLVLMIGANGSGKSCIFDAFEWLSSQRKDNTTVAGGNYYPKTSQAIDVKAIFDKGKSITNQNNSVSSSPADDATWIKQAFYGRAARYTPDLSRTAQARQVDIERDSDRPRSFIAIDQRFEGDFAALVKLLFSELFSPDFDSEQVKTKYIVPFNQSLERIFGKDRATSLFMLEIVPALDGKPGEIKFRKGQSVINYDLLSSGEKEVINILLNLFVRRQHFQDTIYFIDELDIHLNTALQFNLIKEITDYWIPNNCQLWTASHSLGFIQYAREVEAAIILDFDQFDFDSPFTLKPLPKETLEVYEIAVPKELLTNLFKDRQLIFCENQNDKYYQSLELENRLFIGVTDKNEVYYRTKNSPALFGLMDRDYLTKSEITQIRQQLPNLFVLHYYAFENYLYHPDNLHELLPELNVEAYRAEITRLKNESYNRTLLGLKQARSYKILKDEKVADEAAPEAIANDLESDDFETFYPYFDMKGSNRQYLAKYNLSTQRLTQTKWFKAALSKVLQ